MFSTGFAEFWKGKETIGVFLPQTSRKTNYVMAAVAKDNGGLRPGESMERKKTASKSYISLPIFKLHYS